MGRISGETDNTIAAYFHNFTRIIMQFRNYESQCQLNCNFFFHASQNVPNEFVEIGKYSSANRSTEILGIYARKHWKIYVFIRNLIYK